MEVVARMNQAKYDVFRWRYELAVPKKLALALVMAGLTGLLAQARLPLPWSPVPITGQTFAALLAGVMLGRWWGGISMAIYAALGVAGIPWFNGGMGGVAQLAGPTGGYIFGFVLAALFIGHFTDKYVRSRSFVSMLGLMLVADFVLVFVPGLAQLGLWLNLVKGSPVSLTALLGMGLVPFIAGDVTKAVLAALVARGMTPKTAYNSETDGDRWARWRLP
jgi:biotin transport system substrate-specific component